MQLPEFDATEKVPSTRVVALPTELHEQHEYQRR